MARIKLEAAARGREPGDATAGESRQRARGEAVEDDDGREGRKCSAMSADASSLQASPPATAPYALSFIGPHPCLDTQSACRALTPTPTRLLRPVQRLDVFDVRLRAHGWVRMPHTRCADATPLFFYLFYPFFPCSYIR